MSRFITLETDAVTGTAQTVAARALSWIPGVSQGGRLGTELTLPPADARRVAAELEAAGYRAWLD